PSVSMASISYQIPSLQAYLSHADDRAWNWGIALPAERDSAAVPHESKACGIGMLRKSGIMSHKRAKRYYYRGFANSSGLLKRENRRLDDTGKAGCLLWPV